MASIIKVDKIAQASGTPEFTIPTADGAAGNVMQTDGSGQLSVSALAADTVGVSQLSATGTGSATTFLRGDNSWATVSTTQGITHASMWDMTTDFASDADPIASNWLEFPSHYGYVRLGAAMTESSGLFTFPATGFWMIEFHLNWKVTNAENRYVNALVNTTTDNSTYIRACESRGNNYADSGANVYGTTISKFIFDVTSVSTHKCSFASHVEDNSTVTEGGGAGGAYPTGVTHHTFAVFVRLGDT